MTGAVAEYIIELSIKVAKIAMSGDAIWWGMATVTTVRYGDVYPVTTEGRISVYCYDCYASCITYPSWGCR
jgi:hypothetical protein